MQPNGPAPGCRQLLTLQIQELIGGDLIGQDKVAVRVEHGRKHQTVKDDVVLSNEMDQARRLFLPVFLPSLRLALSCGPSPCGADIANRRIKPYIDHLAIYVHPMPLGHGGRNRYAPWYIARYGSITQTIIEPRANLTQHIRLPVGATLNERFQPPLHIPQGQVPMG